MSRGRYNTGTAEKHEGRPEIDDEERYDSEDAYRVGNAHESPGGAPAAFDGVGSNRYADGIRANQAGILQDDASKLSKSSTKCALFTGASGED